MQAIFISVFILMTSPQQFVARDYMMTMTECLQALDVLDNTIENSRTTSINGVAAIYVGSACIPVIEGGEL